MKPWLIYSILTILCWGLWGVFSGLASNTSRPRQTLLFQAVGVVAVAIVVLTMERFQIQHTASGFWWSFAAGAFNFIGFLFFFAAVNEGKVSTVISLSSLYPVITIALSIAFLHEKISRREGLGVVCAITAGWLLSAKTF